MSYQVENTQDELNNLVGATIVSARILSVEDQQARERAKGDEESLAFADSIDQTSLQLVVRFRDALRVNDSQTGVYEVWQDEEGNGPGYFAYVGDEA